MKESEIQRSILDLLAAKHVMAFRMNSGAMSGEHRGKKWFMRFGAPGMADILAFIEQRVHGENSDGMLDICQIGGYPLWIEVKNKKGKQSDLQKSFQAQVEAEGHRYVIARSVDDVLSILK